jgi:membrane protein YqaA with SNARE-associated domain
MLKKMYDKCVEWAGHRLANPILAFISFLESFIFPIPTDAMLIPMVIAKRNEFLKISLIAIIFSVLGAIIGYLIGYVFFNEIGIKIFEFFGAENANVFKEKLASETGLLSGIIILFIAGFTPLPFKIITISSGFVHFNIFFFIITCLLARGLRFFLVAYLTYKYGASIGPFLEKRAGQWTVIISAIIVVIVLGIYFIFN